MVLMSLSFLKSVTTLITAGYLVGIILFGNGDFTAKIFEMAIDGQKVAKVGGIILPISLFILAVYYAIFMILTFVFLEERY